jgi:hypothetical protein
VGRGNTALIVEATNRKYRMGKALPTETINEMADLISSLQRNQSGNLE